MTKLETRLAEVLTHTAGDRPLREALVRLLEAGLIDWRACERQAIFGAVRRAEAAGIPRCEAFEKTAGEFCCSYEKVRNAFYRELRRQIG